MTAVPFANLARELGGTAGISGEVSVGDAAPEELGQRAAIAMSMLGVVALAAIVAVVADMAQLGVARDILAGEQVTLERLRDIDDQLRVAGIIQLVSYVLAAIGFLLWYHRAYRNGIALGARPPRYGTGWAIGYWFIPFVNLVRPKQVMNDIWRGSDPEMPAECPDFAKRPLTPMLTFWWAGFLISGFAARIGAGFELDNVKALESQAQVYLFADVLIVASAALAAMIVWKASQRQAERRRLWEAGHLTGQALIGVPATPAPAAAADPDSKSVPPPGYS